MERSHNPLTIYQLRIVLRGISPLIWRRVLVHDTTTLAQLHEIIQILFEWRDEHLYDFHIYGKGYGTSGAGAISDWKPPCRLIRNSCIRSAPVAKMPRHPRTFWMYKPTWSTLMTIVTTSRLRRCS